jgi:hypothetical protein
MKATFRPAVVAICFICSISTLADQQQADVVDSDEIADALTEPRTRGLTRGIGVRAKGKVDLNIPFDVDSSDYSMPCPVIHSRIFDSRSPGIPMHRVLTITIASFRNGVPMP